MISESSIMISIEFIVPGIAAIVINYDRNTSAVQTTGLLLPSGD